MLLDYIYPPKKGWEENTWYLVEVAFDKYNVIHRSLFYTGFLNGMPHRKFPGNYNMLVNPTYDYNYKIDDIYYMRVIKIKTVIQSVTDKMNGRMRTLGHRLARPPRIEGEAEAQ